MVVITVIVSFLKVLCVATTPTAIELLGLFGTCVYIYNSKHRNDLHCLLQCSSKAALSQMESELGCHYTVLLELPYFSPIQTAIIDPMHNLFIGSESILPWKFYLVKV